jgi:hypothetical protein
VLNEIKYQIREQEARYRFKCGICGFIGATSEIIREHLVKMNMTNVTELTETIIQEIKVKRPRQTDCRQQRKPKRLR